MSRRPRVAIAPMLSRGEGELSQIRLWVKRV